MTFFKETGTSMDAILHRFTTAGWVVTIICLLAIVILGWFLITRYGKSSAVQDARDEAQDTTSDSKPHTSHIYNKVRESMTGIWQGVISLRNVKNIPLFIFYTLAIWSCYFLHYYLTFFCFDATAGLGLSCAMVTFIVGSIAVIVPTPNGAGPWHFAVKTMLILYGVQDTDALYFVLIVHSVQTLLVVALGVYAWIALYLQKTIHKP